MGDDPNGRFLTPYLNTSGTNVWAQDFPLDCKFFFFSSFPFFVSQYRFFFLGLERENVRRSDEKKSVGFFLIITLFIYLFYFSFSLLTGYFILFVLIANVAKILIAERCNVRLFFFWKLYMWQHFKGSFFLFVTTSLIVGINFLSASAIIYSIWYDIY